MACWVRRWRYPILVIGIFVTVVLPGVYLLTFGPRIDRTFKIGFQNSAPYHFPDAAGHASGPAVDVIQEAARRKYIHLQWVYTPDGPEKALSSGAVDLWPLLGDLPQRRKFLYISPPWVKMTYALLFLESLHLKKPSDLAGQTLAVREINLDTRIARGFFDNASILPESTVGDVVVAVCAGTAKAGILVQSSMFGEPASNCPKGLLRTVPIPGAMFWFGIGAPKHRPDAQLAANMLRDEIGEMANDGTLAGIDFRWRTSLNSEVGTIFEYRRARH